MQAFDSSYFRGKSHFVDNDGTQNGWYSDGIIKSYICNKIRVKFDGSCLKQNKITFTHGTIVNIYIVYEISVCDSKNNYPTLKNPLFGADKLSTNADIDKYKYSGYGIGFDRRGTFSFPTGRFSYNVIIKKYSINFTVTRNKFKLAL